MAKQKRFTLSDGNVSADIIEIVTPVQGNQVGTFKIPSKHQGQEFNSGFVDLIGWIDSSNSLWMVRLNDPNDPNNVTGFARLDNVLQHTDPDTGITSCQPGDNGSGALSQGNTMGS